MTVISPDGTVRLKPLGGMFDTPGMVAELIHHSRIDRLVEYQDGKVIAEIRRNDGGGGATYRGHHTMTWIENREVIPVDD